MEEIPPVVQPAVPVQSEQEFVEETTESEFDQPEDEEELESSPEILEKELVSKWTKASLAEGDLPDEEPLEEDEFQEEDFEETTQTVSEQAQDEGSEELSEAPGAAEPDASASHNVGSCGRPLGFRLFGFLGKLKGFSAGLSRSLRYITNETCEQ